MQNPSAATKPMSLKERRAYLDDVEANHRPDPFLDNKALLHQYTELTQHRALLAKGFSEAVNQLANHLLTHPDVAKTFFLGMDQIRKNGIKVMGERNGKGSNYHQLYHAIQVSYDSMREAEKLFGPASSDHQRIVHLIILSLVGAAAAWHDNVQGKKIKTHNETASADEFSDQLNLILDQADPMIKQFLQFRDLIAEELIVNATYLDFQTDEKGDANAKSLASRIDEDGKNESQR